MNNIESKAHGYRVAIIAGILIRGRENLTGLSEADCTEAIETACILHDIGRGDYKKESSSMNEFYVADEREHPLTSLSMYNERKGEYGIAAGTQKDKIVKEIILLHHEQIDGGGYPQGLKGDEIPLYVQLISIADMFDMLCRCNGNYSTYSKRFIGAKANKLLEDENIRFSSEACDIFRECFEEIEGVYCRSAATVYSHKNGTKQHLNHLSL